MRDPRPLTYEEALQLLNDELARIERVKVEPVRRINALRRGIVGLIEARRLWDGEA